MTQHGMTTILLFVYLSLCFELLQSQKLVDGDQCLYSDECKNRCCFRDSPKDSGKCSQKTPDVRCYGRNEFDRCFYSHQCHTQCCDTIGTVKDATCVRKNPPSRKCFGRKTDDLCYASENCDSGCCHGAIMYMSPPRCGPNVETAECFGPKNEDFCALNEYCESGCCQRLRFTKLYIGRCKPKAKENDLCGPMTDNGLYDYCPCESGLTCEKGTPSDHLYGYIRFLSQHPEYILQFGVRFFHEAVIQIILKLHDAKQSVCKKPNTVNKCI